MMKDVGTRSQPPFTEPSIANLSLSETPPSKGKAKISERSHIFVYSKNLANFFFG